VSASRRWTERVIARAFRLLFPGALGEEARSDLERAYLELRARRGGWTATLWYAGHLLTPDTWRLARALRRRDTGGGARFVPWDALSQDLRFAGRTLRKSPGFATVVVATLGLGIGAATALFSVVEAVLLRPLPYGEPDRIVQLWQVNQGFGRTQFSEQNFHDVRDRSRSFEALGAYEADESAIVYRGRAMRATTVAVSDRFFGALGVRPAFGRAFLPEELRTGAPVAVVSEAFWRDELGAPPVLGSEPIRIGEDAYTIIGVLPAGAAFPWGAGLWVPRDPEPSGTRTGHNWRVIGRLAPGVTLENASEELTALAAELKREHGDDTAMVDALPMPLREQLVGSARPALIVLLVAALFLLVVACANVVGLLLARGASRRAEIAVRQALGAGRGRLAVQILVESLVLAAAGGALGLVLAQVGVTSLLALEPGRLPRAEDVGVNGSVLAFATAISVGVALGLGLIVSARAMDADVGEALTEASRSRAGGVRTQRLQSGLTAIQLAMTLVLLVGAALLGRSFLALSAVDPGYRTSGAVVIDTYLAPGLRDQLPEVARTREVLLETLRSLPGVSEVGIANAFPMSGRGSDGSFLVLDRPDQANDMAGMRRLSEDPGRQGYAEYRVASSAYFRAMNIPLLRGRLFDERDAPGELHAAVVSQSLAEGQWAGEDPLGKIVQYGNMDRELTPYVVVGVVADVREDGLDAESLATFYGNALQRTAALSAGYTLVLTSGSDAAALLPAASAAIRDVAPDVPVRVRTLADIFSASLAQRRFNLILLGAFALTAVALAVTGIYGVISYLVAQRTREWAIRLALGASGGDVIRRVLAGGAAWILGGIIAGTAVALAAGRLLEGLLYGITATDPPTLVGVAALLTGVSLLASYVPAARATRTDPMSAMRE